MRKKKVDKRVVELSDKLAELALDIEYKRTELIAMETHHARFSAALYLLKNGIELSKDIKSFDVYSLLEKEKFYEILEDLKK